jgi:U3 small nucleolar RNA-associated protein 22
MRLVKKWFRAHLLSGKVSDELVELLTIWSFISTSSPPNSVMAGFLQTLRFISVWDWRTEPAVIGSVDKAMEHFEAIRKADPGMNRIAMVVLSEYDPGGTAWTELGPKKVIAARITALARSAITAHIKVCSPINSGRTEFLIRMIEHVRAVIERVRFRSPSGTEIYCFKAAYESIQI